jgi:hypothetical protein
MASGTASSPRRALAIRPDHIRCLIRCSSASLRVPLSPSYLTLASFWRVNGQVTSLMTRL